MSRYACSRCVVMRLRSLRCPPTQKSLVAATRKHDAAQSRISPELDRREQMKQLAPHFSVPGTEHLWATEATLLGNGLLTSR